jgi:hypothetical protein
MCFLSDTYRSHLSIKIIALMFHALDAPEWTTWPTVLGMQAEGRGDSETEAHPRLQDLMNLRPKTKVATTFALKLATMKP